MISRVTSLEELAALPARGIEAQKIRALAAAYGVGYDFCRFYRRDGSEFIAALDGKYILCGDCAQPDETAGFLCACGFAEIFCAEKAAEELAERIGARLRKICLMRYADRAETGGDFDREPRLDAVYGILKTAFDIEYEPWYLDMSHRIRHGVSRCAVLGGATLTVQHDINGEALLSQIATLPEERGKGAARRLIRAVCGELAPSETFVLCENGLTGFYRKCGFERVGTRCLLAR